jgi:uncharacterized protein YifN (PemK superfamily)
MNSLWKIEEELKLYLFEVKIANFDWSSIIRDEFFFTGRHGNNSFLREKEEGLHIPAIRFGHSEDLKLGKKVVFCDLEEGRYLRETGLESYICGFTSSGIPIFVCDNHNLVLEAWQLLQNNPPTLIHIDQHKDNAQIQCQPHDSIYCTRICDYIHYAQINRWIKPDYLAFVESRDLRNIEKLESIKHALVNIDLDFFVKEMSLITIQEKIAIIAQAVEKAEMITIATSPGFIDQKEAIQLARLLWDSL